MLNRGRGIVAVAAVAATLVAAIAIPSPANAAAPVTVYAHRGGAGLAPENTLGAFRQTHSQFGADGVWLELDTQLTADNQLVVMHDDTLDRTTTCTGTVISHTLASLAGCDASEIFPGWDAFEPVPTLRDVLVEGRDAGWSLMVEIKDIPLEANFDALGTKVADVLVPLVREVGFPAHRLIVQSFWPRVLDRMRVLAPEIPRAFLTSSSLPGLAGIGIPALLNFLYSTLLGYAVSAPAFDSADLNAVTVLVAHLLGRQVVVWTPDTPADIGLAISYGVDGVISNRPDLVFAALS
jgi:glycerophosphoryl diester phosphodiesterase